MRRLTTNAPLASRMLRGMQCTSLRGLHSARVTHRSSPTFSVPSSVPAPRRGGSWEHHEYGDFMRRWLAGGALATTAALGGSLANMAGAAEEDAVSPVPASVAGVNDQGASELAISALKEIRALLTSLLETIGAAYLNLRRFADPMVHASIKWIVGVFRTAYMQPAEMPSSSNSSASAAASLVAATEKKEPNQVADAAEIPGTNASAANNQPAFGSPEFLKDYGYYVIALTVY